MQERPKDIVEALEFGAKLCEGYHLLPTDHWMNKPGSWSELLHQAAKEFKELREQYEIQNDSYSRLCKQLYGNG